MRAMIEVARPFVPMFTSGKNYINLKGPRSNGKTTAGRQDAYMAFTTESADIICARYSDVSQRQGFFAEMLEEISMQGLTSAFTYTLKPLELTYKPLDNRMYFHSYGGNIERSKSFKPHKKISRLILEEVQQNKNWEEFLQARATYLRHLTSNGKIISIFNIPKYLSHPLNEWSARCEQDPDYCCLNSTWRDVKNFLSSALVKEIEDLYRTDPELAAYMYDGQITGDGGLAIPTFNRARHVMTHEQFVEYSKQPGKRLIGVVIGGDNSVCHDKTGLVPYFCWIDGTVTIMDLFYYDPLTAGAIDTTLMSKYVILWLNDMFNKWNLWAHYKQDPITRRWNSFLPIYFTIDCSLIGKELVLQLNKTIRQLPEFADKVKVLEFTKKDIQANNQVMRSAFRMDRINIYDSGSYYDYAVSRHIRNPSGTNLLVKQLETVIWNERRTEYVKSIENDLMDAAIYGCYSIFSGSKEIIPDFKYLSLFDISKKAIELRI